MLLATGSVEKMSEDVCPAAVAGRRSGCAKEGAVALKISEFCDRFVTSRRPCSD